MADVNATFARDYEINVILSNQTNSTDAFQRPRFLVPLATNSLNGAAVAVYLTLAEATTAQGLGYIAAATLKGIATVFAQSNSPSQGVSVASVDVVGSVSYAAALIASIATDPDFYLVICGSRVSADIAGVALVVETCGNKTAADTAGYPFKHMIFAAQSADTTLLTGALPAGLSAIAAYERTILCYHPTATEWFDATHQNRLSVDLATATPPWNKWTAAYVLPYPAGTINFTQVAAAQSIKVDLLLELPPKSNVVSPGLSQAGRQMTNIITADWMAATIQETIVETQVNLADNNQAITMDAAGQQAIVGCIQSVFETAIGAGSVRASDDLGNPGTSITPLAITAADKLVFRLRFDAAALLSQSANKIVVNIYTDTTSIA